MIDGTSQIISNWCVGYNTWVNLSTSLNQLGDKAVYTLTIINKLSLRAVINSIKVDNEYVNTTKGRVSSAW